MAAVCLNLEEKVSRESALINMNQEMEESEENVLVRLYDRFQLNAIDQIISHLSFEDLSNASRAFEEWKHIFNDFKVWNKFLQEADCQKMQEMVLLKHSDCVPWLDDSDMNRWMCMQISSVLKRVRENWLTGTCTTRLTTVYSDTDHKIKKSEDLNKLVWNAKYAQFSKNNIIGIGMDGQLQSWNRWSLELEAVFDDPFSKRKKLKPKLETIHVNDTVVVGEFNYKFLCIWSLKTKQVISTNKILALENLKLAFELGHLSRFRLRGNKDLLFCSRKKLSPAATVQGNSFSSAFILMTLPSADEKGGAIMKERKLFSVTDRAHFVDFFDYNETIVIFNFDKSYRMFEIRSTATGQRLWALNTAMDFGPNSESTIEFCPDDGLLLVGNTISSQLKIWKTTEHGGDLMADFQNTGKFLHHAHIVKDKFVLTVHLGKDRVMSIKVWDLNLALSLGDIDGSRECLLVDSICQQKLLSHSFDWDLKKWRLSGDEFQILLLCDDDSSYEGDHLIAPKPFLVADLLDDGLVD